MRKRILSTLLSLCMVLTMLPISVLADEVAEAKSAKDDLVETSEDKPGEEPADAVVTPIENYELTNDEPVTFAASSGTCGDNLTWELNDEGILVISGSGNMKDYTTSGPWSSNIKTVVIEEGVTSIGFYAFANCSELTNVSIPTSLTYIGYRAFYNCAGLTSITIPDSVTLIGSQAFYGCSSLVTIIMPATIDGGIFSDCTAVAYVKLTGTGPMFDYSSSKDSTPWYIGSTSGTSVTVVIEEGITSIGRYAFNGCTGLSSVSIPDSITSIGERAFGDCSNLSSLTMPINVTNIGKSAFYGCSGLTHISIPNSVTDIGDLAFAECSDLTNIVVSNNVTSIGEWTFRNCSNLTRVTLPANLDSIGERAFEGCSSLSDITIPDSVTSIELGAFCNCTGLTSVTIPDSVTSIGNSVFSGCSSLKNIGISSRLTNISNSAFLGCSSLTSVTIPNNVTSIDSSAFSGCSSLTSVTISNSVTSIGRDAFFECGSLTNVTMPATVSTLYSDSFAGCTAVTNVKLTGIGPMTDYTLPASGATCTYTPWCISSKPVTVEIENGVTSIGAYAFYDCDNLVSISIPNSVISVGNGAFSGCSGLTSIVIPDSVTSLTQNAFCDCTSLSSITMPATCSIDFSTFSGCISVSYVELTGTGAMVDYQYDTRLHGPWYSGSEAGNLVTVNIRDGITSVGTYAFSDCHNLTSIIIPASVTSIGKSAFYGCSGLTDVYFGGSKEQWEAISVDSGNERLNALDVIIHYTGASITGPVRLLTEWDAENQRVRFNTDIIYYSITDETDLPAESLETLVGRYVLVDSDDDTYFVHSIRTLESALGEVTAITSSTITIDGKTYPLEADVAFPGALIEHEVLYHMLDGRVVSVDALSWSTGILDNYNSLTGAITIDGKEYLTCFLANLDVIDEYDLVGSKIGYAVHDRIVIQLDPDPVDPDLPNIDEFEVSVYRANTLIHPPYFDEMTSLKGFSSPSRILVSEFSQNYWWLASSSVWSTFTNIMDTASKPSNLYAIATAKRDYYEALIFDLLEVSTNYGYVDYAKGLISEAKSWNGEIQNIIGVKESLEDINELTSDQKSLLEKAVKTKFIESYSNVHKDDIGKPTEGLAVINEVFALSSSVLDIASSIEDYLEIMATSFALVRMEDSLKAVVRQMLASCSEDETALRDALRDIVKVMDATKEELFVQLMSKQAEIVGWNASKQLIDDFWSKGVLNCSPEVQALLKIYKTEKWLLNYVSGVEVDDIVEAGANVTNFVVFENLMLDVVSTLGGNFSANKTTDTANAYLSAIDIMFATWLKSCSTAVSFEASLESEESFGAGMITHWIHLLNSNKGESADTLAAAVKNYEKNYILTYDRIWNGWIQKLNDDYPNSGLYEKYRDLLVDFSNKYEATSFVRKKVEVKCPVDVFVYDKSNNVVASAVAGDAWYDASAKDITVVVEGDAKTLYLYDKASYRIECVGTDTGLMDVIVTEYDDGSEARNVYFYDLPLTDGKTFEMSVDDKILSNADYELDSGGETLEPDLDTYTETSEQYTLIVVSGTVSGDDEAVFEGKYYAGEFIEVTALIDANQTFTGWVSNSYNVTFADRTARTTTFRMPAESVVVKAEISGHGYAIYLDGNGGTPESVVVATNLDGKLDAMPTAAYMGHTLTGWYTAKESGEAVTTSTVFSEDTTVYAHWTQNIEPPESTTCTITFDSNGGTGTMEDIVVTKNITVTLPPSTFIAPSGKEFKAWQIDGEEYAPDETYIFTADATVIAIWKDATVTPPAPTFYTVTFDPAGGTVSTDTMATGSDGKLSALPTATRSNYTFAGWYTAPTGGTRITLDTVFDRDTTVYAQWNYSNVGSNDYDYPSGNRPGNSNDNSNSGLHPITTPVSVPGGKVTISPESAKKGDTVTITATPDNGYELDYIKVADKNGAEIHLTERGNGKYIFTMTDSNVTLDCAFKLVEVAPPTQPTINFTDVSSDKYYYDAVAWAVAKGITNGTSATTFGPNDPCTRGQIVTFLWRAAGSPSVSGSNHFVDVKPGDYWYDAVLWAVSAGITDGTSATTFSPNDICTRGQAVTFLYRYEKSPAVSGGNAFTDVPHDAYYTNAVQWAVNNGITSGTSETTFSPNATCTRGQIVTFLYRDMA